MAAKRSIGILIMLCVIGLSVGAQAAIYKVVAGKGLTGGGKNRKCTINVGAGPGVSVSEDGVGLDAAYTDAIYVNEGEAGAITTPMIGDGAVTLPKLGTLQPGQTETGIYAAMGTGGGNMACAVNFPIPLSSPVSAFSIILAGAFTADCPALGVAAPGHLCLYETANFNRSGGAARYPIEAFPGFAPGAGTKGFIVNFVATGTVGSYSMGEWAVTAP